MPDDGLIKYGDHACPRCGSHDTETVQSQDVHPAVLTMLCSACGHTWTKREGPHA